MPGDHTPTLILVDVQRAFDDPSWGHRNNPDAEARIASLLEAWRTTNAPLVHIRHRSQHPQGLFRDEGLLFKAVAEPLSEEPVVEKHVNSAFIGTNLESLLRRAGATTLVIAGLTTDHCCSTTARMAANLGFRVLFITDATATFPRTSPSGRTYTAEEMHDTALASLAGEFAEIIDTRTAIAGLST